MRQAAVLVSDDSSYSLNGKFSINGIYGNDIQIPNDPTYATQLVFTFIIETDPDDPFQKLELHVELPGGDNRHLAINLQRLLPSYADQKRWRIQMPLLFLRPILKPGFIEAKVIHERGEISPAAPAIVLPTSPTTAATTTT